MVRKDPDQRINREGHDTEQHRNEAGVWSSTSELHDCGEKEGDEQRRIKRWNDDNEESGCADTSQEANPVVKDGWRFAWCGLATTICNSIGPRTGLP
jgi:hypothetical protein